MGSLIVVLKDHELVKEAKPMPVAATSIYISTSVMLLWYAMIFIVGSYIYDQKSRKQFLQRALNLWQQEEIIRTKTKNESMQREFLETILPSDLVEEFERTRSNLTLRYTFKKVNYFSRKHVGVSMLYADLVGFTSFSAQVDPFKVMVFLNELFQVFDGLCDDFNVYKIETVGDCYVAAVGVVTGEMVTSKVDALGCKTKKYNLGCGTKHSDVSFNLAGKFSKATTQSSGITQVSSMINGAALVNARDLMGFAKVMIWGSRKVMKPVENTPAVMRVGVHTGSCISGIMGTRNMKFCLLGDGPVVAATMEKTG